MTRIPTILMRSPVRASALALIVLLAGCSDEQAVTEPGPNSPPLVPVVFESSWSTETGNSLSAVTDGGIWPGLACQNTYPATLTVVAGAPVGFTETANVLRVQMRGPTDCGMLQKNGAVPASTTHWGRFYIRNDEQGTKNDHPTAYHNIHGSADIQAVPFARHANRLPEGQWQISVPGCCSYPDNKWYGPALSNGVWYRYEWRMEYLTATTFRTHPRIYSATGELLYDARNFVNDLGNRTLQEWYDAGNRTTLASGGTADAELARNFGMGNEGPGASTATMGYWYYARLGLSTEGWLGR